MEGVVDSVGSVLRERVEAVSEGVAEGDRVGGGVRVVERVHDRVSVVVCESEPVGVGAPDGDQERLGETLSVLALGLNEGDPEALGVGEGERVDHDGLPVGLALGVPEGPTLWVGVQVWEKVRESTAVWVRLTVVVRVPTTVRVAVLVKLTVRVFAAVLVRECVEVPVVDTVA
eukprot:RCo032980